MPLWSARFSIDELRCLLTEGRAALNGKPTRDGLDFARAVAQLGIDRGIDGFQRYAFLMRSGKAFLATPLNRMKVQRILPRIHIVRRPVAINAADRHLSIAPRFDQHLRKQTRLSVITIDQHGDLVA